MSQAEGPGTNLAGTVLEGAYRLVRLQGQGGMGAVYEAVQLRLNKRVAVKLMARELASNQEALARFHREAEITSQLGHPHLVTVVDFGTAETGEPYLVMEYLEGEDLEHRIQRAGCLPVEAAVNITKQVASALGAAHAKDVVHRDLKPANIFLMQVPGEPEFVKVLDFGISKVKAARAKLTRATAVVGTPNYMSPEQAAGRVDETDHRADQWALACIVWEMLSGRTPFVADDTSPLFYQITNLDPEPLAKHAPDLPPDLEPVLRRALSKRPPDRYPTIRDFSRAFEEAALGRPADLTPTPVTLSQAELARSSAVHGVGPSLGGPTLRDTPDSARAAVRNLGKLSTFSHSRGEVTQQLFRRRIRPVLAILGVVGLLVLAVGLLFLRTGALPAKAVPSQPAPPPSPAIVVPLPTPPPKESPPAEPEAAVQPVKPKQAEEKVATPPAHTPRRKVLKARPKRRIFQEL
ncbi:MAG: serine/threonine protein kinase [Deltaproteobacteria bacterium]|nr:serine/threonine protein kinase [Deltaproteobacteria bacterium]